MVRRIGLQQAKQGGDDVPPLQGHPGLSDASEGTGVPESRGEVGVQDSEHHDGARDTRWRDDRMTGRRSHGETLSPQWSCAPRQFPTLFWGLSGFFVNDLMGKALWKLVENAQRFPRCGGRVLWRPRRRQLPQGPSVCDKIAASSDCSRPVNDYVHIEAADLRRPNARTTERQGYQVLTPFGKLGYSPNSINSFVSGPTTSSNSSRRSAPV